MEQDRGEIVVCPGCGTKNRVPPGKPREEARCGRCRGPLSTDAAAGAEGASYLMRCGACGTRNRVSGQRLDDSPKCGKCGVPLNPRELFESQPIIVSQHNFADKVLHSPLPVLLYAMSPSCPSCGVVGPHVEAFAREHRSKVRVVKLNVQSNPDLAAQYQIMSVPYLLIFDRGRLQESMPGGLDRRGLAQVISRYLY